MGITEKQKLERRCIVWAARKPGRYPNVYVSWKEDGKLSVAQFTGQEPDHTTTQVLHMDARLARLTAKGILQALAWPKKAKGDRA